MVALLVENLPFQGILAHPLLPLTHPLLYLEKERIVILHFMKEVVSTNNTFCSIECICNLNCIIVFLHGQVETGSFASVTFLHCFVSVKGVYSSGTHEAQ